MSTTGRLPLEGGELFYRIDGHPAAPALVLSNSLGTDLSMWDPQMVALAGQFKVVRYDQRGHGSSDAPTGPYAIEQLADDVVSLLDHLEIERASFVGLSLGGMVGMRLAASRPERLERLVLSCTAHRLPPASAWQERAAKVRSEGTESLVETLLGRWFTSAFLDQRPDVAARFSAAISSCSDDGYASCCEAIEHWDGSDLLEQVKAPTLVVAGQRDAVTTPAVAAEMAKAIPRAGLAVLSGASHLANVERPEEFTEAVLAHLTGPAYARGLRTRTAVLGEDHVARSVQSSGTPGSFSSFQRLITETAWGSVWSRPALDIRTRRLLTLALLAGLGRLEEFSLHVRAALTGGEDGLDADEIGEVLIHTAVYAGVPAANAAFARLGEIAASLES